MKISKSQINLSASDIIGHLNCQHQTILNLSSAKGIIQKPKMWYDPQIEILRERGKEHEENYLRHLEKQGVEVTRIEGVDITSNAVEQTIAAIKQGKAIITQGALEHENWVGRADVLVKVDTPSELGDWSYEIVDTKLARETKGATVLQLSLYSDLLSRIQGIEPEFMHVVMPWSNYEPQAYRYHDYAAYYRQVKRSIEQMVATPDKCSTYPDPKDFCDFCDWRIECDKKRRADDHLCVVAGISKKQTNELIANKHETTTKLAEMPLPLRWKPERGAVHSYTRLREQARLQLESRKSKKNLFEILPLKEGFGLYCLPTPSQGDIFLDFEGDPYVDDTGLEYLLGFMQERSGKLEYVAKWALSKTDERRIFEEFVDHAMETWKKHTDMHIYHFHHYEPSALKRLMGRYGSREEEIDSMLRAGLFVDLSNIMKKSIRASVESYSLKKIEPFYNFNRKTQLKDANVSLGRLQGSLELNSASSITVEDKSVVQGYNEDDCASTHALRQWLEEMRQQLIDGGANITRPEIVDGAASENITEWIKKITEISEGLLRDVPTLLEDRSDEQQAKWILANILDWHRREEKATWWEFFRLKGLSAEELHDEKSGLAGLTFVGEVGGTLQAPIHRYKFPPQDTSLRGGEALCSEGGDKFGSIISISFQDYTVDIKKRKDTKDIHVEAIYGHDSVPSKELANALVRLGEYVSADGMAGEGLYQSARDLLLRLSPRIGSEEIRTSEESPQEAALRIATKLQGGILSIQGPPGTGKTFTGSQMICALVNSGKKVGITANSHKVIRHLLDKVVATGECMDADVRCIQKPSAGEPVCDHIAYVKSNSDMVAAINGDYNVAGATAWFWSRADAFEVVDVLFVDEAAQMSLANVLAVSQAAKTVVMLGDPQQLDQPIQGCHPEGTALSALNHVLDESPTISPKKGLFLEETWRLHPKICSFTSEIFYDNKLHSKPGLESQVIKSAGKIQGSGLRYVAVDHQGNQNYSPEEAVTVSKLVKEILETKSTWIDYDDAERPVTEEDILIITPYNPQVYEIQQRLPNARVGTVDKFQGQQAAIAIYSMATSSHADAPRGMEFLYSLNRLNVASSRAKCISILVGSSGVFQVDCKTPHQMRLANAFCRYLEMAEVIEFN